MAPPGGHSKKSDKKKSLDKSCKHLEEHIGKGQQWERSGQEEKDHYGPGSRDPQRRERVESTGGRTQVGVLCIRGAEVGPHKKMEAGQSGEGTGV